MMLNVASAGLIVFGLTLAVVVEKMDNMNSVVGASVLAVCCCIVGGTLMITAAIKAKK